MLVAGLDDPRADQIRREGPRPTWRPTRCPAWMRPVLWALRDDLKAEAPFYVARGLSGLAGRSAPGVATGTRTARSRPGSPLAPAGDEATRRMHSASGTGTSTGENPSGAPGVSDDERSWSLRARALRESPSAALAESLSGIDTPSAGEIRRKVRGRHPLAVLRSLRGLSAPEAWELRNELAGPAPKAVAGVDRRDGRSRSLDASRRAPGPGPGGNSRVRRRAGLAARLAAGADLEDTAPVGVIQEPAADRSRPVRTMLSRILMAHPTGSGWPGNPSSSG
jgi:hypothetical protein